MNLASLLLLANVSAQIPAPSTDIYLVDLDSAHKPVGGVRNLTTRMGYDNQPFFLQDGSGILYASQRGNQSDIYRVDFSSATPVKVTDTPESEYSPTVMPDGLRFSVIRVEQDGRQRLWSFLADGSDPALLFADIEPVGYQCWADSRTVALFILGDAPTLQLARIGRPTTTAASNIGRSLKNVPASDDISFIQHQESQSAQIMRLDVTSGAVTALAPVVAGSQDFAWTFPSTLLMAKDSQLFKREPSDEEWVQIADLSAQGITGITRLAVGPEGRRLAFVARDKMQ